MQKENEISQMERQSSFFQLIRSAIYFITLETVSELSKVHIPNSHRHLNFFRFSSTDLAARKCPLQPRRPILGVAMTCICTPRVLGRLPPV